LMYLAAAGIGKIGIVDGDRVALNNLHRQVLYSDSDIGTFKASTAAKAVKKLNPTVKVDVHILFLNTENVFQLLDKYDLVIDGTDNYPSRYLLNDACVLTGTPLIYGAIYRFEGQVGVFNYQGSPNYRDLFPQSPRKTVDCSSVGVMGILPGIVGTYQAAEAIKIITGIGQPLTSKILYIDILKGIQNTFNYSKTSFKHGTMPSNKAQLLTWDYGQICLGESTTKAITEAHFKTLLLRDDIVFLDVREPDELPRWEDPRVFSIPLTSLQEGIHKIPKSKEYVLFCQMGFRSLKAMQILRPLMPDKALSYIPFSINKILQYAAHMD